MNRNKPFVISVHNVFSNGNIPLETFLTLSNDQVEKEILSFYQNQQEVDGFLRQVCPGAEVKALGLNAQGRHLRAWYEAWRVLKKQRKAIVHVHHSYSALVISLLAKNIPGIQVVMTVHAEFHYHPFWRRFLLLCALYNATHIICNSRNTRRQLEPWAKYFRTKPIDVIYNGVDIERIKMSSCESNFKDKGNQSFTVATVGRLIKVKDLPTLLKGFAVFKIGKKNVRLIIVGDGPEQDSLVRFATKLGIKDSVSFTGQIARKEVYSLLKAIDVFTITSQAEGFCNSMVEAMAAGCAVVASEIATLKEILGNESGLFIEPGDSKDLARTLNLLYTNIKLRYQLGSNATKRAEAAFSLKSCAQRHSVYYKHLLDESTTEKSSCFPKS